MNRAFEAVEKKIALREFWQRPEPQRELARLFQLDAGNDFDGAGDLPNVALLSLLGESYYWNPVILQFLQATAPVPDSWVWRSSVWPSSTGFAWFAEPVRHEYSEMAIAAVSWVLMTKHEGRMVIAGPANVPIDDDDAMAVFFWLTADGNMPAPATSVLILMHLTHGDLIAGTSRNARNPEAFIAKGRLLASMCAFLEQRILVAPHQAPTRAQRRRFAGPPEAIEQLRVVKLRKTVRRNGHQQGASEAVEWSCQWAVAGHWKHHWYARSKEHRPIWIAPFIKGPDDKPFKQPSRVFAVVR